MVHAPVAGSHVPASWQASPPVHTTGAPAVHAPAWQVSPCVQALPSSHAVPLGLCTFAHWPVAGLHTPAVWQASPAGQTTGAPAVQAPAWHVSPLVQPLASSHVVPSGFSA
jgi:hypothetical protein